MNSALYRRSVCKKCRNQKISITKTKYIVNNFSRSCPKCNKYLKYNDKYCFILANKNNSICRSCATAKSSNGRTSWNIGIPRTEQEKQKMSKRKKEEYKKYGFSSEHRQKISLAHRRRLSEELRGNNRSPRYNLEACKIFDEIEKELNWNGFYGTKNGEYYIKELGYWVDYYEPNLNIVIEYDESHHNRQMHKQKDILRQKQIEQQLKCQFYRIREKMDWRCILC